MLVCLDLMFIEQHLQRIAADGVVPGLQWLGLHRTSGHGNEPRRATAFTFAIAVPFAFMGIEVVALAAAVLFLQMYLTVPPALLAAAHRPRPVEPIA